MDTYSKLKEVQHKHEQSTGKYHNIDHLIYSLVTEKLGIPKGSSRYRPNLDVTNMLNVKVKDERWPADMR